MKTLLKRTPLRIDRASEAAKSLGPAFDLKALRDAFENSLLRVALFRKPADWRGAGRNRGGVR